MYLRINASALSGRTNDNTIIPRVSLRLPWAMRSLGFQPVPVYPCIIGFTSAIQASLFAR